MESKYVIKKNELIKRVCNYKKHASVYYPVKANSNIEVLRLLDSYVSGYEVESINHLDLLLKELNVKPERIIFSSFINNESEIRSILLRGINKFVVDNLETINSIISISNISSVSFIIRLDLSQFINCGETINKWGAFIEDAVKMIEAIKFSSCEFCGVSFYLPQELNTIEHFKKIIYEIGNISDFKKIKIIDIGGGIDLPLLPEIVDCVHKSMIDYETEIIIEPGRHLLNPCIDLICTVKSIRKTNKQSLLIIDCGIYNGLLDKIIKNRLFDIELIEGAGKSSIESYSEFLVCGPTSDSSDVIGLYSFPSKISVGSNLLIKSCGAYCSELNTVFYQINRVGYATDS